MKQSYKTILLWLLLIVVFVAIYQTLQSSSSGEKIPFSEFITQVDSGTRIVVRGQEIEGMTRAGRRFSTVGDISDYVKEFVAKGVEVSFEPEDQNAFWLSLVGTWLPMIFLFVIFFFFMRQIQAGGGRALSFGKSRHRLLSESAVRVTFDDIAGIDEAKDELQEIIDFLKDPKKFTRLGGRIPKGVLLMGPPGTGKTLLARGVAGEAGVPFFSISGSDFVEMFVGVGASRVRDLFEQGKKHAPCIIFIDEIDAVGRHRGAGLGGGHDEREQTLNQLLVEMDGFESNDGVILIAATNRPDVLDPALLRPGRFDRRVVVHRPDVKGRLGILKVHTRKVPLHPSVSLDVIARSTPGFSGADLENVINEAALLAAREDQDNVTMDDLERAKDKVLMGAERRSLVISEHEKKTTAYHEAGHALVAFVLPHADPLHKVTIIPRGRALGLTQQLPEEDRHNYGREWVIDRIAVVMGGRIAEEVVFNELTTGAGEDIQMATELAHKMVCEWGMSNLGPIAYGKREEAIFLGKEIARNQDYSESTALRVDREIKRIINDNYDRARRAIEAHRDRLEALAQALLELETLDAHEVAAIMGGDEASVLKARRPVAHSSERASKTPVAVGDGEDARPGGASGSRERPLGDPLPPKLGEKKT